MGSRGGITVVITSYVWHLLVITLAIISPTAAGDTFTMLSTDQHYIIDTGGQVSLQCEFYKANFNLFDNPVQWKKSQYGEVSEINIMGNIKYPFETSGRFTVTYEAHNPKHTLIMTIIDISKIDSGNYTCEVKGPKNKELGTVRYTIFTREPVDEISIVYGNASRVVHTPSDPTVTLIENDPTPIRCITRGGSPPPEMEIFIDQKEYTDHFRFESQPSISGPVSFRLLQIITMLVTDDFRAALSDDGKTLHCKANVQGMVPVTKSAIIHVHYEPMIECTSQIAKKGEKYLQLNCTVTARPPVKSWHWILDDRGTTIDEGEFIDQYWTSSSQRENILFLQLHITEAKEKTFRSYRVFARNAVGSRIQSVSLQTRQRASEPRKTDKQEDTHQPVNQDKKPPNTQDAYTLKNSNGNAAKVHALGHIYILLSILLPAYSYGQCS